MTEENEIQPPKEPAGMFFPVTGTRKELEQIYKGLESTGNRLTADDSMSADLYGEMLDYWWALNEYQKSRSTLRNFMILARILAAHTSGVQGAHPQEDDIDTAKHIIAWANGETDPFPVPHTINPETGKFL